MVKKLILLVLILNFVISCGKKGDPEYKGTYKYKEYQKVII